jgi:hypothetical protein
MNVLNLKNHNFYSVPKRHYLDNYKEGRALSNVNLLLSKYDGKLVVPSSEVEDTLVFAFMSMIHGSHFIGADGIHDQWHAGVHNQGVYVEIRDGYSYMDFYRGRYKQKDTVEISNTQFIELLFKISSIYTIATKLQEKEDLQAISAAMYERDATIKTTKEYFLDENFSSYTKLGVMLGVEVDSYISNNILYNNPVVNNYKGSACVTMQNGDIVHIEGKNARISKYGDISKNGHCSATLND